MPKVCASLASCQLKIPDHAALTSDLQGALVGSYEGPLFENRQAFKLFSDVPAPQDPGWEVLSWASNVVSGFERPMEEEACGIDSPD